MTEDLAGMDQLAAAMQATLPRTEVRSPEQYQDLTNRRAKAAGYGTLIYRLREPGRAAGFGAGPLTTMGNRSMGSLEVAVVHDRLGTDVAFTGAIPMIGLMGVLAGAMHRLPAGRTPCTAGKGEVMVCATDPEQRVLTADGTVRANLWLNATLVTRHLEDSLGTHAPAPLVFAPTHEWPSGTAGALARLIRYAGLELADPHSFFARGVGVAAFTEMAVSQLIGCVPHNYSDRLLRPVGGTSARAVRQAEAFMRANLDQPLLLTDIARAAGCSVRALTGSYRQQTGRTVAEALRDMRLDAARTVLSHRDPAVSVAAVAAQFGFSNPGRFAAQYRARFGESPTRVRVGT